MRICFTGAGSFIPFGGLERQLDGEHCSAAGLGMDMALTTQLRHPLMDSEQSESFHLLDVEALAVILNGKSQAARILLHADPDGAGARMTRAVVERLLHDAIDTGLVFVGQVVGAQVSC